MPATVRIETSMVGDVHVVQFLDRQLFDERIVREIAEQVSEILPSDGSPIKAVLDFSNVELISSSLLSKLIMILRRVDASRGQLRLCELSPILQAVFKTSNLDRLFKIDRDQRAALSHMGVAE